MTRLCLLASAALATACSSGNAQQAKMPVTTPEILGLRIGMSPSAVGAKLSKLGFKDGPGVGGIRRMNCLAAKDEVLKTNPKDEWGPGSSCANGWNKGNDKVSVHYRFTPQGYIAYKIEHEATREDGYPQGFAAPAKARFGEPTVNSESLSRKATIFTDWQEGTDKPRFSAYDIDEWSGREELKTHSSQPYWSSGYFKNEARKLGYLN